MEQEILLIPCQYCDQLIPANTPPTDRYLLCDECSDKYDNKTGYCSLDCCVGGHCDDSC